MAKIIVYINTGNVYEYDGPSDEAGAREHAYAIIKGGYRSVNESNPSELIYWPPHQIFKVRVKLDDKSSTKYFDTPRGT